jgi:hypothetical protein
MPFQPPPATRMIERMRSRIYEINGLTTYDYRSVILPVYTPLSASVLRGNAVFRIPFNQEFRVQSIRPHVVPTLTGPGAETLADGGSFTAGSPVSGGLLQDRLYAKAMNCRADIKIVSGRQTLFAQKGAPLSDFWGANGADPRFFDSPLLLPSGTTIEVLVSLQDAAAAGSATEYGFVFSGAFVRDN